MEQALRGWLQHYTDHAIHFWRELGYRTLEQPLPAPEFEELPDTAREPLRHAWLLYDDSHLRLYHLELTTAPTQCAATPHRIALPTLPAT
jgi:hypothetical protein